MKKSRILIFALALALICSALVIFPSAEASDVTVRKSSNYNSSTLGYTATASDAKNPTLNNTTFQIGGRTGKIEVAGTDADKYVVITQGDKVGTSSPYAYLTTGSQATQIKDSAGNVTGFNKSATDISNFKFMMFEIDVMSPTGKFITNANIDIQGRRVSTSGATNSYWNTDANTTLVKFGNSNGATYLYAGFDNTVKKYIDPYQFTNIQIIVENVTTAESTNYEIKTHVYVNGELWFTKEPTNTPTAYFNSTPNAVLTEMRVNFTTSTDSTQTLAIDNLKYSTVPVGSETLVSDLVKTVEKVASFEYVTGGETVIGYNETSLANAILLADEGTTVKLLRDCRHDGDKIPVSKNLTLDLNGHTIDATIDRARRDAGLFVVSASKTFTLKSSSVGAKIFSAASGADGASDPIIATNANSVVNVYGADASGNTTLSVYGANLIRAWSADCKINIDGGEYYRNRISDNAIVQAQSNFTVSIKNAFFYDMSTDATDGVFCFNGRYAIGTTKTSVATIDNCVIISNNNIVTHTFSKANVTFTNCYLSGDIKPETFSNTDQGTQTAGTVSLGKGCFVNGELAENVVAVDGLSIENIAGACDVIANYNTFDVADGKFTSTATELENYSFTLEFGRKVCDPADFISVVWKDAEGNVIAETTELRGDKITAIPYDQFVENGATYEYKAGYIDAVPNEWNESLTIPEDFSGSEYVITAKADGALMPYVVKAPVLFNVTAESGFRVNFYVPETPEGIEFTEAYIGENKIYDAKGTDWSGTFIINGEEYNVASDLVGVIKGATERLDARFTLTCDGYTLNYEVETDFAYYCNTVLDGSAYSKEGKDVAVNIANYLIACADLKKVEYTDITNELLSIVSENASRISAPLDSELIIPDTTLISPYISSVSVVITENGPSFVFTLTEEGRTAGITLSSTVGNSDDEDYTTVGWIKTGNDRISNINRITVTVIPAGKSPVSLTYSLASYCKALEGEDGEAVARALYGFARTQMSYTKTSDVSLEKYSSHSEAITVNPGDEITYYIKATNYETSPMAMEITDGVPENTVYVSGADSVADGILTWSATVPAGETKIFSYTVKVNGDMALCDGGVIESTEAIMDKISVTANDVYVERTFNSADVKYIDYAIDALEDSTFKGITLAKWIYYVAYSTYSSLESEDAAAIMTSILDKTASAALLDKIAPTLYGGSQITEAIDGVKGAPCAFVSESDLVVGDVIISIKSGFARTYIYGTNGLYCTDLGCVTVDLAETLSGLVSADAYAVFRISAGMTNFTPTDLTRTPDVLTEKQQAIVDTAKYYLQRGQRLQYDDTYFCYAQTSLGNESRWEAGMKSPEEFTKQNIGHINCAAFTHDVYWTTFGQKLPNSMFTTANLTSKSAANNMNMYSFTRTADQVHTDEEKAKVKSDFLNTLEPGDIMVILRGTSGHAMLYIGDGLFIHSSGSSYNYSGSYGVETYDPTIRYNRVNDYFFSEASTNGYVFGKVTSLCIVRPLNNATWAGYEVTENSKNRIDNLMGITAEKLPSVYPGQTVNPGDEITYTFSVKNNNFAEKTLEVTDKIPEGTEYVSGCDSYSGGELSWSITVPARSTVEFSYTVKVSEDVAYGTKIASNDAKIGGVIFKTYQTTVRRTLSEAEQAALITAFDELKNSGTTLTGIAFANELYKNALGIDNNVFDDTDLTTIAEGEDGFFTDEGMPQLGGKQAYTTNDGSKYFNMIAPTLFGGRRLSTPSNQDERTHLAYPEHLVIGDILFGRTSSSRFVYIYLGGDTFVSLTTLNNTTVAVDAQLERLMAYSYHFAILRPSFALEA